MKISYTTRGRKLEKEGKLEEAIASFQKAIEMYPRFSWSYFYLGNALIKQEKFNEAIKAYSKAVELNPTSALFQKTLEEATTVYQNTEKVEATSRDSQVKIEDCLLKKSPAEKAVVGNFVNISYLCSYFTSSISSWEKWKIGNPLDSSTDIDRYSFHTEEEKGAFIQILLPIPCSVKFLSIYFRRQYTEKILPLGASVLTNKGWISLTTIDKNKIPFYVDVEAVILAIRIEHKGFGSVYFSSINIFVERNVFLPFIKNLNVKSDRLAYVYAQFYGLGGQLAVFASALGFIGSQNSIKQIIAHKSSSAFLAYPTEINLEKSSSHFKIISAGLSESLCSFIFNNRVGYNSKKNISQYIETGEREEQNRSAVFISRNSVSSFCLPKESLVSCTQRLYSRIIPSDIVLKKFSQLEEANDLKIIYPTSLGVHVRHGNGERYFSKTRNQWGVKPPNSETLVNAIKFALAESGQKIENIILASDCLAVRDFLNANFADQVNIVFISQFIQNIGAGCNHNSSVFDKELPRSSISREEEDILAFAEILALSKCFALCGGSSYFFEAVIGFSSCSEGHIFKIDNLDRYIVLNDNCQPLFESNNHLSDLIRKKIKTFGGFIDGVFIDEKSTEDYLKLYYFDDLLYLGSFNELMKPTIFGNFYDKLKYFRLY